MSEQKFNQISNQYQSGHREPTVLIRRSNETIQPAYLTNVEQGNGRIVRFTDPADGMQKIKKVMPEALTDDFQEHLAETLGASRTNSGVSADTLPRELLASRFEESPETIQSLGEAAVSNEIVLDNEASHEAADKDKKAAEMRIAAVLGEDDRSANVLAATLRAGGDSPAAIRQVLADTQRGQELRSQVSTVLSRRMEELLTEGGHFHERVQANSPNNLKTPEGKYHYEKKKYRSDEYVVLLAMAKLDGSFDISKERNSYTDYSHDHSSQGQHRQASDELLASFVRENTAAKPEHERRVDPAFLEAQEAIETMFTELLSLVRMNDEQLQEMEYLLQSELLNLDDMDERTNVLVQRVYRMYEVIESSIDAVADVKSRIKDDTIENIRKRHLLESTENTIRSGMNIVSVDFALEGVGVIDRKTQEARYDGNMQAEYRAIVGQTIRQLYETQQRLTQALETARI